jgi:choline dehydrogenase
MRARGRYGYFGQDRGWQMLGHALRYALTGKGAAATTGIEACLFFDPRGGARPTIQLYCVPIVYLDRDITDQTSTFGMTLTSCLLRPQARGSVRLRSADPFDAPLVDANFFGHPDDMALTMAALRHARRILAAAPLARHLEAEVMPGPAVESDDALAAYIKATVKTNYHPSGSCRMGPDGDPMAVLDPQMRVRGTANLRVIDCAAIPAIPSANTNAIAMVLGRKGAIYVGGARAN